MNRMGVTTSLLTKRRQASLVTEYGCLLREGIKPDARSQIHVPLNHRDASSEGISLKHDRMARFEECNREMIEETTSSEHDLDLVRWIHSHKGGNCEAVSFATII